ncbi:DUF5919 domain-containing protein [Nonomuraea sp. NPDC050404]|uniref:DUF5919 domain-containing protein n=1 Tax=Nonomuraea sp. NPDC050404 TaxID=3155783 RepID=UPI0033D3A375
MKAKIRALAQPGNIVPALVIAAAFTVSLDPKILGVEIEDRQVVLLLFALLAIDAVVERSGRLRRIDGHTKRIADHIANDSTASSVLRDRSSFERMGALVSDARRNVMIIGINLDGAMIALPELSALAKAEVAIRLLAMDPDGSCLESSAQMSHVHPEVRRQKIRQNLQLLRQRLDEQLPEAARRRVDLRVVDQVLPVGVVGTDVDTSKGKLIVQHYLTAFPGERSPMIMLRRDVDETWFKRYLEQCEACFVRSEEWR